SFDRALKQDGAHAFEDIGRCKGQGNPLEPGGQDGERIVDTAQGHEREYQGPGDILRTEAIAQQKSADEEAESPARQHQVEEEGDEPQAEPVDIEAEEEDRKQAHRHDTDQYTDDADDRHRENMLERPQGADEQVSEIARVKLLQEGEVEAELAAEEDIPEEHAAYQGSGRRRGHHAALHK